MGRPTGLEPPDLTEAKSLENADLFECYFLGRGNTKQREGGRGMKKRGIGHRFGHLLAALCSCPGRAGFIMLQGFDRNRRLRLGSGAGMDKIQRLVPEFPVNGEMPAVGRDDPRLRKDLSQTDHRRVAEIHLRVQKRVGEGKFRLVGNLLATCFGGHRGSV
jgi:hypothetical protein